MRNDIDTIDSGAPRELVAYREKLRRIDPSAQLDAAVGAAICEFAIVHDAVPRRRWPLALAASAAVLALVTFLLTRPPEESTDMASETESVDSTETSPFLAATEAGSYSLWPTEAVVLRVRTSLDMTAPSLIPGGQVRGERQFWIDVRVANDGSMRIVNIVPAEELGEPSSGQFK